MERRTAESAERRNTKVESVVVTRVHEGRKGLIFFDMVINGICINGMSVVAGERGDFLSFPSYKGKDGKYYHSAWAYLSDEDTKKIMGLVQSKLDE